MIPLIRKNIRLLGIGKNLLLFIGCFLFSFSSRGGTVLSFEQHLLSGTTDHYYLIFFLMPLILLSCLPLAEDDPPYVIFRFGSYRHYFIRKWISLGVLPAILVLVQLAAILLSGVGLPMENTWRLPDGSLEAELFEALSQVFSSPLAAFAGCTGYLFLGIWLISGLCMWLAHFAGHKHSVRIVVGLYVLSILWVKVPGIHAFPITGLNHLLIKFIAIYPVLWFLAGLTGGLIFADRMDLIAIQFLVECVAFKFLDILLQTLVMLFCYLLTRQITVGFLAILAGNFLCVIPQNWVHYLPFGLSGTVRVDWDSFGMGIPAGMAMMILIGCLAVTLSLLELLGSKNLLGR